MAAPPKASAHSGAMLKTSPTEKTDLLERFHTSRVCDILPTNPKQKLDIFDEFRPKPRTVLDYNISQTDTKIQRQVPTGIQKIHIQQTTAEYELPPPGYVFDEPPLPPPPTPPQQYGTGGGPVWEFWDDIRNRTLEKRQLIYKQQLKDFIIRRKKTEKEKVRGEHLRVMKLIGPDWFQELSPQQLRTVDNLKNCIMKDVKNKTIFNTQDNIAALGLVLRPDPRHVQIALKKCCECPVEFLLLLYQLMNRHRTKYSLNDRLLLSGVVHLTMRETLKELHIRIPSPPPPDPKKVKSPKKKKKPKHYKSPYLVPFTFTPARPKHTGIYKNRHIQYPESPYFSYRSELVMEYFEANDDIKKIISSYATTSKKDKDILDELKVAQRIYNELTSCRPIPRLHKPSIYVPCDHGKKHPEPAPEEKEESKSDSETNISVSVRVRVTTDFDEFCEPIKKICECTITFDEKRVSKSAQRDGEMQKFIINGVTFDKQGKVVYIIGGVMPPLHEMPWKNKKYDDDDTESLDKCPCIEEVTCPCTTNKSKGEVVPSTSEPKKLCICEEDDTPSSNSNSKEEPDSNPENLVMVGKRESNECKCKEEVERIINTNLCPCDKCKANREEAQRKKLKYIISGTKLMPAEQNPEQENENETSEEQPTEAVPIIAGVKPYKPCDCLEKYRARVAMYEKMKKRFDVQHDLLTVNQKFIIGGVTSSPAGEPVYMLSGVVPDKECTCVKMYQEQLKEEERLAKLPSIPMGKLKYVISGVHAAEGKNVFVVSGTAPTEDCKCMKIYKEYEKRHQTCVEAYSAYLKKIEIDKAEYMAELAQDSRFGSIQVFHKYIH